MIGIPEHAEAYVTRLEEDVRCGLAALEQVKYLLTKLKPDEALEAANSALGKMHINNHQPRTPTNPATLISIGAHDEA